MEWTAQMQSPNRQRRSYANNKLKSVYTVYSKFLVVKAKQGNSTGNRAQSHVFKLRNTHKIMQN